MIKDEGLDINDAIDQLLVEGYLTEFFDGREVRDMFAEIFSYDQELIEKGIEKGIERKSIEIAKNLISMNVSLEQIAEAAKLPVGKIKELQGL